MYRAARTWVREHPRLIDGATAAPIALLNAPFVLGAGSYLALPPLLVLACTAGLCLPYIFRRQFPALTFGIMASTAFVQWLLGVMPIPANLMLYFGLYNVASRCDRRVSVLAGGVVELGALLATLRWGQDPMAEGAQLFTNAIFVVSVWIWGNTVGTRRAYLVSLEERAVRLERERDNQAQIAAAAERARIAREMHDVVSHSLSVIVVQADGAGYAMETDPGRAQQALSTISTTGRTALTEMRRMLGVLRDGEEGEVEKEYGPQPGIAQLDQMVQQVRRSGLPVEFTVEGVPQQLPAGMELAAYRVVQEALTNTLKHAGPSVCGAQVRLRYGDDMLEMCISDDGRGAAVLSGGPFEAQEQQGHGLIGMRERVAAYGGSVRSGPKTGGGFEVVASLPLRSAGA